jgi:hypothetical protein
VKRLGVGEVLAEPGDGAGAVGGGQRVEGDVHAAVDEADVGGCGEGFVVQLCSSVPGKVVLKS